MNTLNNLPYLPTEIWDKIFDIKYSLEDKEDHKNKQNMVLKQFNTLSDSLLNYYPLEDWFCMCEAINNTVFMQHEHKIYISVFSRSMCRLLQEEKWKVIYDPLSITDDESDDEYLYD